MNANIINVVMALRVANGRFINDHGQGSMTMPGYFVVLRKDGQDHICPVQGILRAAGRWLFSLNPIELKMVHGHEQLIMSAWALATVNLKGNTIEEAVEDFIAEMNADAFAGSRIVEIFKM